MIFQRNDLSAIDLWRDYIEARDKHDQVGDHQPAAQLLNHPHRGERTGTHMHAPWIGTAVAHDVPSLIAARALDPYLAFAHGRPEVAHHLREHRPVGYLLERLAQD